jgi:hypothetical protein
MGTGTAALSGRTMAGSARFDTCLTVVIAANIIAAQKAPISAETMKRGSTTRPQLASGKPNYAARILRSQSTIFRRMGLIQLVADPPSGFGANSIRSSLGSLPMTHLYRIARVQSGEEKSVR